MMKKKTPRNRKKCDVTLLWQQNFWITTIGSLLKVTKTVRRRRQRERRKSNRFDNQNNNFARASRFFVHFLAVVARLRLETSRFMEWVNTAQTFSFF